MLHVACCLLHVACCLLSVACCVCRRRRRVRACCLLRCASHACRISKVARGAECGGRPTCNMQHAPCRMIRRWLRGTHGGGQSTVRTAEGSPRGSGGNCAPRFRTRGGTHRHLPLALHGKCAARSPDSLKRRMGCPAHRWRATDIAPQACAGCGALLVDGAGGGLDGPVPAARGRARVLPDAMPSFSHPFVPSVPPTRCPFFS
jgi:hypothetical protein